MITLSFSKSILEKLQDSILVALRLSNIRLYRLANALLWYAEGAGVKEIAKRMGVHIKTIINWLTTLNQRGQTRLISAFLILKICSRGDCVVRGDPY